uniref:Uncharacterized protein n=1 Tax=Caenorhabditis japonica TaxID=281687 RepID=A0A8R1HV79_CAEJA
MRTRNPAHFWCCPKSELPERELVRKRTAPEAEPARKRTGTKENCPKQNCPNVNWYKCELVQQRTPRSRTARV